MKTSNFSFFRCLYYGIAAIGIAPFAEVQAEPDGQKRDSQESLPASTAATYYKKLSEDGKRALGYDIRRKTRRFGAEQRQQPLGESASDGGTEVLIVHFRQDPDDYQRPQVPPMMAFRAKLERSRPKTPWEITQTALCTIGLCLLDTSREPSIEDRNEARARNPPSLSAAR